MHHLRTAVQDGAERHQQVLAKEHQNGRVDQANLGKKNMPRDGERHRNDAQAPSRSLRPERKGHALMGRLCPVACALCLGHVLQEPAGSDHAPVATRVDQGALRSEGGGVVSDRMWYSVAHKGSGARAAALGRDVLPSRLAG